MRSDGIVPVMEVGTNNGNSNGMFGDNWAWIIVLFLIFAWGGYGNGFVYSTTKHTTNGLKSCFLKW